MDIAGYAGTVFLVHVVELYQPGAFMLFPCGRCHRVDVVVVESQPVVQSQAEGCGVVVIPGEDRGCAESGYIFEGDHQSLRKGALRTGRNETVPDLVCQCLRSLVLII